MQLTNLEQKTKIDDYIDNAVNNGLPTDAYLQVGTACNAKCVMCSIWKNPVLGSTETLSKIIYELADLNFSWVTLWGGEPFLHPNIIPLMKTVKDANMNLQIITNGVKLADFSKDVSNYVDNLVVSIDSGIPEIHDKIRGVNGIFEKAVNGIKKLQSHKIKPNIEIDCTITNDNADNLISLIELSHALGNLYVDFDPVQIKGVGNNKNYNLLIDDCDIDEVVKLAKNYGVEITSDKKISLIKDYLLGQYIYSPCYSYCKDLLINPFGDVYTCWTIDEIIGNVLEDDFSSKWFSALEKNKSALFGEKNECYSCGFSHSRLPDYNEEVQLANSLRIKNLELK